MSADEFKNLGNKAFSAGDHETAIKHFTSAIEIDPNNHILFSNRSAAYASLKDYTHAFEDAQKCVALKPDWSKGYGRLGSALYGLNNFPEAEKAYQKGLEIDPANEVLKKGLADVYEARKSEGTNVIAQAFSAPDALIKIANSPKTKKYLSQPDYLEKIKAIQANPNLLQMYLSDKRIMETMGVLLNFNLADFGEMETDQEEPVKEEAPKKEEPKKEEPKKESKKEEAPKETESSEEALKKKQALEEKELGTQSYKKKDFTKALEHYNKAFELDPTNISYLTNSSAVYFEMGDFDKCIEVSEKAIEVGREVRADYQLIARAFGRMGSAYLKKDDLDQAITYFNKSLTEHRNPEILTKLRDTEKLRDKKLKEAYINPELAAEEREKGNKFFKEQNYAESVKAYTEATKRDPKDAKNFSNRAAAYTKLLAFPEALKDCEEAIKLDPKFIRAYIRKANVEIAMKKPTEALSTLREASEMDTEGAHTSEISDLKRKCYEVGGGLSDEERASQAERDPQVQEILSDPVMRSILAQIQQDPRALQEHLKNPTIAKKIQKLFEAGIIRTH